MGTPREPILAELPDGFVEYIKEYMIRTYSWDYVKKLSKDNYEVSCRDCTTTGTVNYKTAKAVRKTRLCPYCFNTRKFHTKKFTAWDYKVWLIKTIIDGKEVGYAFIYDTDLNEKPTIKNFQVAFWDKTPKGKKLFYARYINAYTQNTSFNWSDSEYRLRHSSGSYWCLENRFAYYDVYSEYIFDGVKEKCTYKQYVQRKMLGVEYKSNQMELIKHNIFNEGMLYAIKVFDLKTADEVYKYANYINDNDNCIRNHINTPFNLNVHYLDYLSRNDINFTDYYDYLRDLKTLGMKPDKPKDFRFRSEAIGEMAEEKKNRSFNKKMKLRYKELSNNIFKIDNVEIKPIKDYNEITYVAKTLHNCMARLYTKEYARGDTDLYCLWLDGKPFIAIEIFENELEQVRADHNEKPKKKYLKIVNDWFKGLNYGTA